MIAEPITINDKEYKLADLSPESQRCVQHITSIDGKLNELALSMEQLQMCRQGFVHHLNVSIQETENAAQESPEKGGIQPQSAKAS